MNKLLKKFSAFSLGPMVGAVISFITVPLVTYFISPEEYGKTSMFTVAQGTVSMFIYMGLDQAFVREFNNYRGRIEKLMSNAIMLPMVLVLILDVLIIMFSSKLSFLLFGNSHEILAVVLMAVMFPFMVIENFAYLKVRMEEKGLQYSLFTISLKVLILLLTVILFITYEKSFRSVVYAMAIAEIINGVILYMAVIRKLKLRPSFVDGELLKRMLKFGLPLVPAAMLGWALTSMDKIMLRVECTYEELGLYTAAFKIVSVLSIVQSCFTLFWTPVAYRWYDEKVSSKRFDAVMNGVSLVMTSMCFGLLIFKNIISLILGSDFAAAINIFPFILLYPIMYTMSETTTVGIAFMRKTGYNIWISGIAGITNIALNFMLIPVFGGKGAALATGISYIVFFWMRTIISRCLWYKFKVGRQFIYTVVIIINCFLHTFVNELWIYGVTAVSLLFVILINMKDILALIKAVKHDNLDL